MITRALVKCPGKRATARQICQIIAQDTPKIQNCTQSWQSSVYSVLVKRKKFFQIVGTDESNEMIWTLNPDFEKFMICKWVPKYAQIKYLGKAVLDSSKAAAVPIPLIVSTESTVSTNQVGVSNESVRPVSPIFVSSGKTEDGNCQHLIPETNNEDEEMPIYNSEPERVLQDPETVSVEMNPEQIVVEPSSPWEPIVSLSGTLKFCLLFQNHIILV